MSAFKTIEEKISRMAPGSVVSIEQLSDLGSRSAIATALTRLSKGKVLVRIRRGLYLRPKDSRFGTLPPSKDEMLSAITNNGKKSYMAGLTAYNKLGITTQVPNSFIVRGGASDLTLKIGGTKIEIKAGKSPKTKTEIPLLMILDTIREIKLIPDATLVEAIDILKSKIFELDKNMRVKLVDLAMKDKPFVRAMVGAIIDEVNPEITRRLTDSLNPLTAYKVGDTGLKFAPKWKIK